MMKPDPFKCKSPNRRIQGAMHPFQNAKFIDSEGILFCENGRDPISSFENE
jgi:hypothetical protein